ncbi:MAG: tetratricopeptide repeat protein [Planctomycetaceae bacterium]
MTRHSPTWSIWSCAASLLLAGCASKRSEISPSLISELQGKHGGVQQVDHKYVTDSDEELGTKKIKDPLALKLQYARVMEQFENYPDARQNYAAVLGEKPDNFEAVIGLARVDQAIGEHEKAEAGFRKALALNPDSAVAQHALGQFQLSQGRTAEALPLLNKAVLAQPNDKAFRFDLAVALAKSGDTGAALPHFKRTVGEAAAHHNIGTVLRDQGDLRGAEQHFRQALCIQPDLEETRHALVALYQARETAKVAANNNGGSAVQGAPNQGVVPATHQTFPPPSQPLTPTQHEQRQNQQPLTR